MKIIGIGTDLLDIRRIEKLIIKYDKKFINRLFSKEEQKHCDKRKNKIQSYAMCFAAKEAVIKSIGITKNMNPLNIEIKRKNSGKPYVELSDQASQNALKISKNKAYHIELSLSDEFPYV